VHDAKQQQHWRKAPDMIRAVYGLWSRLSTIGEP
jgi:hypothetical protein